MLTKVRMEIAGLFSWRKSLLFMIGTLLCTHAELEEYIKWYEGANLCEFIMFFLTNQYIILMLVTMAVIILSSDRHGFQNRYVILTRYKSRSEFYRVNLYAKAVYAAGCMIVIVVLVTGYGRFGGLSGQAATFFTQISYEIVAKQCFNILGYAMFVVTLYSLLHILVRNKVLDVLLMMGVPLFNLMAMKSGMSQTEKLLPWYQIAYELHGWEMYGYRFHWEYWLMLVIVCFWLGDCFFRKKDIVYENH